MHHISCAHHFVHPYPLFHSTLVPLYPCTHALSVPWPLPDCQPARKVVQMREQATWHLVNQPANLAAIQPRPNQTLNNSTMQSDSKQKSPTMHPVVRRASHQVGPG